MGRPLLSILVCSIPSRVKNFLPFIIKELNDQALGMPVEILCLLDNKISSVGKKRNDLIALAQGQYIAFVDDDDWVADDYVKSLCETIENSRSIFLGKEGKEPGPDVILFDAIVTLDGGPGKRCVYDLAMARKDLDTHYERGPQHITATKASLAKNILFQEISLGEDFEWGWELQKRAESQVKIPKTLYYYKFNSHYTETQKKKAGEL